MKNYAITRKILGETIKSHRKAKGLSLEAFSKIINTSASYLSEIERGLKSPGSEILFALRENFDLDLNAIVDKNYAISNDPSESYVTSSDKADPDNFVAETIALLEGSALPKQVKIEIVSALIHKLEADLKAIDDESQTDLNTDT